jgi:ketosteroid isomerase-like protein
MKLRHLGLALAVLALGASTPARPVDQVIAAERAFAADGVANGVRASFPRHAAPDGIVFNPGPVNARQLYGSLPPRTTPSPTLDWWPVFAGASRSGDLGFTTGPYAVNGTVGGWYFTVWRRQADGGWQWMFDGGGPASSDHAPPKGSPVRTLAPSRGSAGSPQRAVAQVTAAEASLAAATASAGPRAAFARRLAPDARVYVAGQQPATGRADYASVLLGWPRSLRFEAPYLDVSLAGDMAWTWGRATWTGADGASAGGYYVRVWQHRRAGWRIVFAQMVPDPPRSS